jgi:hypothetical protein
MLSDLVLYDIVEWTRADNSLVEGKLKIEDHKWHIGLRPSAQEALDRAVHMDSKVSKHSHVVLQVTFHPLGVAYFCTTCQDQSYQFKPMLYKMHYGGAKDWGAWRFLVDLPLHLKTDMGQPMVSTKYKIIE